MTAEASATSPAPRSVIHQLFWFGVSGVLGLLVDMGVLWLATPWLGLYGGRVLSFLCAATSTWAFNRRQTFAPTGRQGKTLAAEYLAYLGTMSIGGAINYSAYVAFVQHFPQLPGFALWGVAVGSVAGLGFNFVSARFLIFRDRTKPSRS
jgi:putative flippase GtrA